jgi:hypothetical protein
MVTITDEEVAALRQALDSYLPQLNFELSRVKLDQPGLRHQLVQIEATLRHLRQRLDSQPDVVEGGELVP